MKTRTPKTLKPTATIEAEATAVAEAAALAAQKAARESNSATLNNAVRDVLAAYVSAEHATATAKGAWEAAQEGQRTKLEETYVALAKLAHENAMTPEMCTTALHAALVHFYGEEKAKAGVGTVAKLRAQLLRAMHPKVRAALPTIIQPWIDAWTAETAAIAAERATAEAESRPVRPVPTPIRDKFDNRGNVITQALQLARGAEAKLNGKGDKVLSAAVPSVVCAAPAEVLTWVSAHPRVTRGATPPNGGGSPAPTGTPREVARARVAEIETLVKALMADYAAALDTIQPVLDALAKCTGDRLVPAKQADKPLVPAAIPLPIVEPEPGAVDLDDTISEEEIAKELIRMRRAAAK